MEIKPVNETGSLRERNKMFCMKCGTKLPDDANFCYKCGYSFGGVINSEEKTLTNVIVPEAETKLVPAKCTNCNASLNVDPNKDAAICPYCNSAFIVSKAINNISINNNVNIDKATISLEGGSVTIKNQVDADNLIIRANEFIKQSEYEKTIEYLNKALDQEPDNGRLRDDVRDAYVKMVFKEIKNGININNDYIEKAVFYDNEKESPLIYELFLYLGVENEKRLLNSEGGFPRENVLKIREYYQSAYNIRDDSMVEKSISRIDYIMDEYVFCRFTDNSLFGGWGKNKNEILFLFDRILITKYPKECFYQDISDTSLERKWINIWHLGSQQYLEPKKEDLNEAYKTLSIFLNQQCLSPRYAELEELGLIGRDETDQFFFPRYSKERIESLIKEIE